MQTDRDRTSVTLMDTTLRDGEQTPDVCFDSDDKLSIARALLQAGVDRIEIGSARVSPGEQRSARRIAEWARDAGLAERIALLGFCDDRRSVDWALEAGVPAMNLLVKGSERHCRLQLGASLVEHTARIAATLEAAARGGLAICGVYLEDWSRGVTESPAYVAQLLDSLSSLGIRRVYLADTLGVLEPEQVSRGVRRMCRAHPELLFEFHAHDDYGLATANCLAAVRAGAVGLHTTVGGLGERAGNASLEQIVAVLHDHAGRRTAVDEASLCQLGELVAKASGRAVPQNAPVVGEHVFTQTAGVHADGDSKALLYASRLAPERFGRCRVYALGKLSGRASVEHHLRALGFAPSPAQVEHVLAAVVACGEAKQPVRREDLARWIEQPHSP